MKIPTLIWIKDETNNKDRNKISTSNNRNTVKRTTKEREYKKSVEN